MAAQPAIEFDVTGVESIAKRLLRVDNATLGRVSMRAVNDVLNRGYAESRRVMLSGVNLSEQYVKQRMDVEEATNPASPSGVIVAFRPGGERRPATRPVNLRQYSPKLELEFTNWRNDGTARNSGKQVFRPAPGYPARGGAGPRSRGTVYENPRAPGKKLSFHKRIGNAALGIPVGQKLKSISVEVLKGRRKTLKSRAGFKPFMQRMPNGEMLIMRRANKNGGAKGKGKIESLHSLSVWQMFKFAKAKVIPFVAKDLEETTVEFVLDEIEKAINL